jgi:ABC-2 type transport system ATP-binding protein
MGAARYVGRVGGLAVALGVGAAIFTGGCGVAWAAPATNGSSSVSPDSSTDSANPAASGSANAGAAGASGSRHTSTRSSTSTGTSSGSGSSDASSGASAGSGTVQSSGGAQTSSKTLRSVDTGGRHRLRTGLTSAGVTTSAPDASSGDVASISTFSADKAAANVPSATTGVSTLRDAAARVATKFSTLSTLSTPLSTPAAPAAPAHLSGLLASAVNDVLNPLAGNTPTAPPIEPPTAWTLLAFARREFGAPSATSGAQVATQSLMAAPTTTSLLLSSSPVTVNPTVIWTDGIINGDFGASSTLPLSYTVVSAPNLGGKVNLTLDPVTGQPNGSFTFLPYKTALAPGGTEQFSVLVSQVTPFDTALEGLPVVGSFVPQVLVVLHQVPIVSNLLAPVIGFAVVEPVDVRAGALAAANGPTAYTVMVTSFDGTQISTNWFPKKGLGAGTAATVLNGPGLASPGNTDPYSLTSVSGLVPGIDPLRTNYNVVTWDPRGEFASGGVLQLDSPAYEARDVSAIIDYVAQQPGTKFDTGSTTDPLIGMVGGSYGGGIQLVTAATDPRVDVIVPGIAWNSLNSSLYPNNAFKTSYGSLLLLSLITTGARINNQIYIATLTGDLLGVLTQSQQAVLASSGPVPFLNSISAPTLFIQGTVDVLFPLQQAVDNAQVLNANGVPVRMIWFCGGHGVCLSPTTNPAQEALIQADTLAWLNQYIGTGTAADIPPFQWVDQKGNIFSSTLLPSDPGFNTNTPITASGPGGILPLVPILGGSGPQSLVPLPYSLGFGSQAKNAVDLQVTPTPGDHIAGAPQVTLTYSGIGTSRFVYAQLVDDKTGLVVGNIVTPIPVTLDGRTHTVTVPMEDIAYTAAAGDSLTLQVTSSATAYENFTSYGVINISNVGVELPVVKPANVTPE